VGQKQFEVKKNSYILNIAVVQHLKLLNLMQ